jgi:hypothetical protein
VLSCARCELARLQTRLQVLKGRPRLGPGPQLLRNYDCAITGLRTPVFTYGHLPNHLQHHPILGKPSSLPDFRRTNAKNRTYRDGVFVHTNNFTFYLKTVRITRTVKQHVGRTSACFDVSGLRQHFSSRDQKNAANTFFNFIVPLCDVWLRVYRISFTYWMSLYRVTKNLPRYCIRPNDPIRSSECIRPNCVDSSVSEWKKWVDRTNQLRRFGLRVSGRCVLLQREFHDGVVLNSDDAAELELDCRGECREMINYLWFK